MPKTELLPATPPKPTYYTAPRGYMRVEDVASELNISCAAVYRLVKTGKIKGIKDQDCRTAPIFIMETSFKNWRDRQQPPEGYVHVMDACRRLKLSYIQVMNFIKSHPEFKAHQKVGRNRFIHLEALHREFFREGRRITGVVGDSNQAVGRVLPPISGTIPQGELNAIAFQLFAGSDKVDLVDAVIKLKQPVAVVKELYDQYLVIRRGLYLESRHVAVLANVLDLDVEEVTADSLMRAVQQLKAQVTPLPVLPVEPPAAPAPAPASASGDLAALFEHAMGKAGVSAAEKPAKSKPPRAMEPEVDELTRSLTARDLEALSELDSE